MSNSAKDYQYVRGFLNGTATGSNKKNLQLTPEQTKVADVIIDRIIGGLGGLPTSRTIKPGVRCMEAAIRNVDDHTIYFTNGVVCNPYVWDASEKASLSAALAEIEACNANDTLGLKYGATVLAAHLYNNATTSIVFWAVPKDEEAPVFED